jgi:hypothetical protein
MLDVGIAIKEFFQNVANGNTEIYNECSLQHELGIFLRVSTVSSQYKIQFERPVSFFGLSRSVFVKKEIDIAVFTPDRAERIAIEVKFPRNGQYPEQMFKFCEDVAFGEQLVLAGFTAAFFVVASDDPLFYSGSQQTGIYAAFRGNQPLQGTIVKPTGKRDETVHVCGSYRVEWRQAGELKYACLAANPVVRPAS